MRPARGRVFLSYRRDDTRHVAGRIADRLTGRIGPHQVFMDVDTIEPGVDFKAALVQAVESCDVLLALIGPNWVPNLEGRHRRIDFVLLEIGTALTRGIRVVPVLVDGARVPDEADLPPAIQGLTRRNAVRLDHETFQSDVERLLTAVEKALQPNDATTGATTTRLPTVAPTAFTPNVTAIPHPEARVIAPSPRLPGGVAQSRPALPVSSPPQDGTYEPHTGSDPPPGYGTPQQYAAFPQNSTPVDHNMPLEGLFPRTACRNR